MEKYRRIIENIKSFLKNNGCNDAIINKCFGRCENEDKIKILTELYDVLSYWSSVYYKEDDELSELKKYKVPINILNFYREFEPKEIPCLEGGVYLLGLDDIKEENTSRASGAYLIKFGLLTFATTIGGNALCMDLNAMRNGEPRIVYVDNSWIWFNEETRRVEYDFYTSQIGEPKGELTYSVIKKYLPEVSNSFSEFLDRLSSYEEWDAEDYYEKVGNRNY